MEVSATENTIEDVFCRYMQEREGGSLSRWHDEVQLWKTRLNEEWGISSKDFTEILQSLYESGRDLHDVARFEDAVDERVADEHEKPLKAPGKYLKKVIVENYRSLIRKYR
ncbi:MAG: hypothetical protein JW701_08540 [Kosmotogaceae bacterium]|nr:hypothetical protein [Kosmotogaceae bacterium]